VAQGHPGRQALLVLVHPRKGSTYTELAQAFGVGVPTVYRYVTEALDLLAGLAGCPTAALLRARAGDVLVLDGTLIVTDRLSERSFYSGKHKAYGVHIQQITDGRGDPLWSSPGLPAATHDVTAIRRHGVLSTLSCWPDAASCSSPTRASKVSTRRCSRLQGPRHHRALPAGEPRPRRGPVHRRTRLRHREELAHSAPLPRINSAHLPHRHRRTRPRIEQ